MQICLHIVKFMRKLSFNYFVIKFIGIEIQLYVRMSTYNSPIWLILVKLSNFDKTVIHKFNVTNLLFLSKDLLNLLSAFNDSNFTIW